jgi:hypothetical protein
MNLILSFIGKLPEYIIDCIFQIRLYYKGSIYLILDDYNSIYLDQIKKYNVNLIQYEFINELANYIPKFIVMDNLQDRKFLFFRAFERMFLVNKLLNDQDLTDNIFMEIDNLIYENPECWIEEFSKKEVAYMINEAETCSAGVMYIKNKTSMRPILDKMIDYIKTTDNNWANEMAALYHFYNSNTDYVYIMPTLFMDIKNQVDSRIYENYSNKIFDPASYGQFLLGLDTVHTDGKIKTGVSLDHHKVVCKRYKIEWKTDNDDYKKPYILDENKNEWILISNIHVHSKDLRSGLSMDF